MEQTRTSTCIYALVFCLGLLVKASDGAAADISTCPESLTRLLPCLPFSQGTVQVPSKDCCSNLLTVHLSRPECLCALVAGSVKGVEGIPKLNTTLSLMLGPACNVATKPATCPDLLGLAPDDPLTKIFTNAAGSSNSTVTSPTAQSPTGGVSPAGPSATPPVPGKASVLTLSVSASLILSAVSFVLS